jgi:RNA polymerase sigma factor (sigma-70 family)
MNSGSTLQHLRVLLFRYTTEPDAELLRRFLAGRDEAAFAELVRRHGPMVLGVARRVLGDFHEAEDVFQATFLILARKGASVRSAATLGAWLQRTAYRLAVQARRARCRRQALVPPRPLGTTPDILDELTGRELLALVDGELQALPESYRLPLVLCCLEGLSQEEAAQRLGWTSGSVKGRLERGRAALRRRLARRGLKLPEGLAAPLLLVGTLAAVPAALARGALDAAFRNTRVSPAVLALVQALPGTGSGLGTVGLSWVFACALTVAAGVLVLRSDKATAPLPQPLVTTAPSGPDGAAAAGKLLDLLGDPLPEGAVARVGTTRLHSRANLSTVVFSSDGRRLAFGNEEGMVRVCAVADGKPVWQFRAESKRMQPATELAFSPDGRMLAIGGYWTPVITLLDVDAREVRRRIPNTTPGQDRWDRAAQGAGFVFTPDGRTLVVGGKDGAVHFWDLMTGAELAALSRTAEPILSLTMSADGTTALTAHAKGQIHLWNLPGRKHLREVPASPVYVGTPHLTTLSPDGQTIAVVVGDREIELWNATGTRRLSLRSKSPVLALGFVPDQAALKVAEENGTVVAWDTQTGKRLHTLACLDEPLHAGWRGGGKKSAWFRQDGKMVVWSETGAVLQPWDLVAGQATPRLTWSQRGFQWVGFSADGRQLRVGGPLGELGVCDAATGRLIGKPRQVGPIWFTRYATTADRGRVVVVTGNNDLGSRPLPGEGRILLWDPAGDAEPTPLRGQAAPAWYAALTPDGRLLAACGANQRIQVYDPTTGTLMRSFAGRPYEYEPTFSPDGKLLATCASSGSIRLYEFATGRMVRECKAVNAASCLAFSPDGRILASGQSAYRRHDSGQVTGGMIYLWDAATGRQLREIAGTWPLVRALSFSADGRLLACGNQDGLAIWEVASGQQRRCYPEHETWVLGVDFDPDGKRLASACYDGTAVVWRVLDPAPANCSDAELERCWASLAGDGIAAHQAIARLTAAGQTVAFLRTRIRPAERATEKWVSARLADLGSTAFRTRETAQKELMRTCERYEPILRRALVAATDAEVRRRLIAILETVPTPEERPEHLRDLRALEVLERVGSADAGHLLGELAGGDPASAVTIQAKASLTRLSLRRGP